MGTQESLQGQKKRQSWRNRENDYPQDSKATAEEELTDEPYPPTLPKYWHRKGVQVFVLNII